MVEYLLCMQKDVGSIPIVSIQVHLLFIVTLLKKILKNYKLKNI